MQRRSTFVERRFCVLQARVRCTGLYHAGPGGPVELDILGHHGTDGVAHRLVGVIDGETPVELRALSLRAIPDALIRLEDTAEFLDAHPDDMLPPVYGVVTLDDWAALVVEPTDGPTLAEIARKPAPPDVAATLVHRSALFLERLHALRDDRDQLLDIRVGCMSTAGLRTGRPFTARWCQPESIAGVRPASARVPDPTGGPEDDVFGLGVVLWELLAGARTAREGLAVLADLDEASRHHRALREGLRKASAPAELTRLVERMCSYHADERPLPTEVVGIVSGYQVADSVVYTFLDGRTGFRPEPRTDHPLVGVTLGQAPPGRPSVRAGQTLGPDDYLPPGLPTPSDPRPDLPPAPRRRFDDGGMTVFERQVPKHKREAAEASQRDATPAASAPRSTPDPVAAYVPPPQLDTPDVEGGRGGLAGLLVGGGCVVLGLVGGGGLVLLGLIVVLVGIW